MSNDVLVLIEHQGGQIADISYVMLAAARCLAQGTGGKVIALLLGHNAQGLAKSLAADRVLIADHPSLADFNSDAYRDVLTDLIVEQSPRTVVFGHTTIGTDIAGVLSAKLSLALVSSCLTLGSGGKFICQICGGKIMAEGDLPSTTVLVTMIPGGYKAEEGQSKQEPPVETVAITPQGEPRLRHIQYIEPDAGDVDITKEQFLVAVGRGIQNKDNIDIARELASMLGGQVCASRPIVDQGWLPTSRLVGKSGKRVKPRIYLALGISGAPEHAEGMCDSDVIIGVNTDSNAPIFNVAKYGTTIDMFDLLPRLTEKVKQSK